MAGGGANCVTGPARIRGLLLEGEALRGRLSGKSYNDIAKSLGVSKGAVYDATKRALSKAKQRNEEAIEMLREIELASINELTAVVHPKALAGDLAAVEVCIKLSARRSQLAGLNAPTLANVHQHHTSDGMAFMSREAKLALVTERLAELAANPPKQRKPGVPNVVAALSAPSPAEANADSVLDGEFHPVPLPADVAEDCDDDAERREAMAAAAGSERLRSALAGAGNSGRRLTERRGAVLPTRRTRWAEGDGYIAAPPMSAREVDLNISLNERMR